LAILLIPGILFGQPGDPASDPDNPVPITGIELLIGAGALFGAKKLMQRKPKQ